VGVVVGGTTVPPHKGLDDEFLGSNFSSSVWLSQNSTKLPRNVSDRQLFLKMPPKSESAENPLCPKEGAAFVGLPQRPALKRPLLKGDVGPEPGDGQEGDGPLCWFQEPGAANVWRSGR